MLNFTAHVMFVISSSVLTITYFILITYYGLKYKPKKYNTNFTKSDITVLIPVYKEDVRLFEQVIKSIARIGLKLIVVGDGVDEPYSIIVKKYGGLFISLKKRSGKRVALSEGIKYVTTKLVLLLDSDTTISKDSVEKLLAYMTEDVGGVGANIRMMKSKKWSYYYAEFFESMSELVNRAVNYFGSAIILSGQCVLYRTDLIKPYVLSEEFRNPRIFGRKMILSDDRDLTEYVIMKGYKAVKAIDAIVYTKPPNDVMTFAKQVTRWTRANYLIFIKEIKEGVINKRGLIYSFNVTYLNMLPLLSILSLFLDIHLILSSHLFERILEKGILNVLLTGGTHSSLILAKIFEHFLRPRPSLIAMFIITRILPTISIIPFSYALAKLIMREKLKTFLIGTIALVIQYFASFYALLTFWKQNWSSRDS
ncbi:glycosyltransferase family 2 protein [Stygiolobus sp. CP850M]|uniref:glycosyltransferase family 2 protein n=1 Tax=Stygiolobus sp. CP850M TaxID=3133134 RepID=UPI00307E4877